MSLISPDELATRRKEVARSATLQAMVRRLTQLLRPLDQGPIYVPEQKALLSRDGGVCPADGSRLAFDPLSPERHTCPQCGLVYQGERHHRAWIWRYQLWLSERAIHYALLGALTDEDRSRARCRAILEAVAGRYATYPNQDNVLGPTRPFFSTYLESIWLIQVVLALLLLDTDPRGTVPRGRSWRALNRVVRESAALIGSFNEGWSNRQVWNNTALVAAGRWLDDDRMVGQGLDGHFGIRAQLTRGVTEEGLWFEGENYHFFALRGFLLAAELARSVGIDLYGDGRPAGVLGEMFAAPLKTVLPDLTLPARGDAPFGVTLLQPRFAELWEIGWARTGDPRIATMLRDLYGREAPEGPESGLSELAEQEWNRPPQRLYRERLGWKALLWMAADAPAGESIPWWRESRLLPDAGLVVLRPTSQRYVSVECGGRPGGHGHPDLLHVNVFWNEPLVLDMGTGSYVSPSLHWYRSALAHNGPAAHDTGQLGRDGWCVAFDSEGQWAWCRAVARNLFGPDTEAVRSVVVGPQYVLDVVEVEASSELAVDLPVHLLPAFVVLGAARTSGGGRSEVYAGQEVDGAAVRELPPSGETIRLSAGASAIHLAPRVGEIMYVLSAPGPPSVAFAEGPATPFIVRRANGAGRWVQMYAAREDGVERVSLEGDTVIVHHEDGTRDTIRVRDRSCTIHCEGGRGRRRLKGARSIPDIVPSTGTVSPTRVLRCPIVRTLQTAADWDADLPAGTIQKLHERDYRRAESAFGLHGPFRARVAVFTRDTTLYLGVDVVKRDLCFRSAEAPDSALDNETPDIHSDGLQCYLDWGGWAGYLCVPVEGSEAMRVSVVRGTAGDPAVVDAGWCRAETGYRALVAIELGRPLAVGERVPVNLVVNEMYPHRARRAGQLALSGGGGWVYLRGDREPRETAVIAEVR